MRMTKGTLVSGILLAAFTAWAQDPVLPNDLGAAAATDATRKQQAEANSKETKPSAEEEPSERLRVSATANDVVEGKLIDGNVDEFFRLETSLFRDPLAIGRNLVQTVSRVDGTIQEEVGNIEVILSSGGKIVGDLVSLDAQTLVLNEPSAGRLTLPRSAVESMRRRLPAAKKVDLPKKQPGFGRAAPVTRGWKQEGGAWVATESAGRLLLPNSAGRTFCIEIEMSWSGEPLFHVFIDAGTLAAADLEQGFSLEQWNGEWVLLHASRQSVQVARLGKVDPGMDRGYWRIFADFSSGQCTVASWGGEVLGSIRARNWNPTAGNPLVGVRSYANGTRVERVTISPWNGTSISKETLDRVGVQKKDGNFVEGEIVDWDEVSKSFRFAEVLKLDPIPFETAQEIRLKKKESELPKAPWRWVGRTGFHLLGDFHEVKEGHVLWELSSGEEPISLPIRSLWSLQRVEPVPPATHLVDPSERVGRIVGGGTNLAGYLVSGDSIRWQSMISTEPIALRETASGRIEYGENSPKKQAEQPAKPKPKPVGGNAEQLLRMFRGSTLNQPMPAAREVLSSPMLHLCSGDVIPCEFESIDEKGVHFQSKRTTKTFLPHEAIQAVELLPNATPIKIARTKKNRLLTVPRVVRDTPPTHLIRFESGDYLRCRLLGMNAEAATVEVRLDERAVPRNQIARIIWLRWEEGPKKDADPATQAPSWPAGMMLAVHSSEQFLSFSPRSTDGKRVFGESPHLGACDVEMAHLQSLSFGEDATRSTKGLAFHDWKLKRAIEPLPDPPASGSASERSVLAGKEAPDFELDLFAGGKFKLSDHRDEVVVLDFFASWCGPCMHMMPAIHRVAEEFKEKKVRVVAVNIEETKEDVQGVFDRLGIQMPVVMDVSGAVARSYGVEGIPMTVVIGRGGKIEEVFSGVSSEDNLRRSIDQAISPTPSP